MERGFSFYEEVIINVNLEFSNDILLKVKDRKSYEK